MSFVSCVGSVAFLMPRPGGLPLPNCIVRLLRRGSKGFATSIEVA